MANQLTTFHLVSWLLLGSGAALGQVSSPDEEQLLGHIRQLDPLVLEPGSHVNKIVTTSITHTVQNGETLWGISRKYRVKFNKLAELNGLSTSKPMIRIGQKLRIPADSETKKSIAPEATSYSTHTVAANETLFKIAQRYRVSMRTLSDANGLRNPNDLKIGQTIRVPQYGIAKRTAAPNRATTPKTLTRRNPAPPAQRTLPKQEFAHYTVQPRDTIQSIAKTYGLSATGLLRLNKRAASPKYQPRIGERVLVPTDGGWYVPKSDSQSAIAPGRRIASAASSPITHIVAPNETLEGLAKRFGTTVQQIKLDNPRVKTQNDLRVGNDLRINRG